MSNAKKSRLFNRFIEKIRPHVGGDDDVIGHLRQRKAEILSSLPDEDIKGTATLLWRELFGVFPEVFRAVSASRVSDAAPAGAGASGATDPLEIIVSAEGGMHAQEVMFKRAQRNRETAAQGAVTASVVAAAEEADRREGVYAEHLAASDRDTAEAVAAADVVADRAEVAARQRDQDAAMVEEINIAVARHDSSREAAERAAADGRALSVEAEDVELAEALSLQEEVDGKYDADQLELGQVISRSLVTEQQDRWRAARRSSRERIVGLRAAEVAAAADISTPLGGIVEGVVAEDAGLLARELPVAEVDLGGARDDSAASVALVAAGARPEALVRRSEAESRLASNVADAGRKAVITPALVMGWLRDSDVDLLRLSERLWPDDAAAGALVSTDGGVGVMLERIRREGLTAAQCAIIAAVIQGQDAVMGSAYDADDARSEAGEETVPPRTVFDEPARNRGDEVPPLDPDVEALLARAMASVAGPVEVRMSVQFAEDERQSFLLTLQQRDTFFALLAHIGNAVPEASQALIRSLLNEPSHLDQLAGLSASRFEAYSQLLIIGGCCKIEPLQDWLNAFVDAPERLDQFANLTGRQRNTLNVMLDGAVDRKLRNIGGLVDAMLSDTSRLDQIVGQQRVTARLTSEITAITGHKPKHVKALLAYTRVEAGSDQRQPLAFLSPSEQVEGAKVRQLATTVYQLMGQAGERGAVAAAAPEV